MTMSKNKQSFTIEEVRGLVHYAQAIVFDACRSNLRAHREEEFEENSTRLLRKYTRLLVYPELVLGELDKKVAIVKDHSLTIQERELIFKLIGNRSREAVSMTDDELTDFTLKQLRNYKESY